jgi:cytochrome c-type biogenesis protein CcmH/NrfG
MRAASLALLVAGFGVGFGGMYKYISPRAVEVTKPIEQFVPQSAAASAPQPADPALIKKLEDRVKADPKDFAALRQLGDLHYDERNFVAAADVYTKALAVHPDDVDLRSDFGGVLVQSGKMDEAVKELQIVLAKNPTHPQALFIMGVALLKGKDDREGALANWRKLVASHPDLPGLEDIKNQIKAVEDMSRRK